MTRAQDLDILDIVSSDWHAAAVTCADQLRVCLVLDAGAELVTFCGHMRLQSLDLMVWDALP